MDQDPPVAVRTGLINARSLANKTFIVKDFFLSQDLDFLFVTESWIGGPGEDAILSMLLGTLKRQDVNHGRECVLKGLCVYLNEDPKHLIQQHVGVSDTAFEESVEETTVGIFTVKQQEAQPTPDDVGIILEGQIVIQDLDNVPLAVALLFGLLYALNMDYPHQLRYTFEVLQKLIMELDGGTLSKKVQVLKNRLNE